MGYEDFIPSYWNGISRMTINDCDLREYSSFSSFHSVEIEDSTPASHGLAGHTPSAAAANVIFLTEEQLQLQPLPEMPGTRFPSNSVPNAIPHPTTAALIPQWAIGAFQNG